MYCKTSLIMKSAQSYIYNFSEEEENTALRVWCKTSGGRKLFSDTVRQNSTQACYGRLH